MLPRAFVAGGEASKSTHYRSFGILSFAVEAAYWHHLPGDLQSVNFNQYTWKLAVSRSGENLPSFAENTEANFRIGQRVLFKQMMAMAHLGMAALQKL